MNKKSLSLFFRHLFTSIKKRPAQPILLMIVLSLAVAVCVCAVDVKIYMEENDFNQMSAQNGSADISVTVNSTSGARFMLVNEAKKILPEGVDVCGLYALPVLYGSDSRFAYGVATDFNEVNSVFSVSFSQTIPLEEDNICSCIYVTDDFASDNNIAIGSKIQVNILGNQYDFSVYGISEKKFFGTYSVLFDVSSVLELFKKSYGIVSMLEDEMFPAGSLYISSNGKQEEVINILSEAYPDMTVTRIADSKDSSLEGLQSQTVLIVITSIFFVMVVVYCCVFVLSAQRKQETDLFYSVGAKRYMLFSLSVLEMALYWLVGCVLGTLLSLLIAKGYVGICNLEYCTIRLHAKSLGIAALCSLLSSECSLFIFSLSDIHPKTVRKKNRKKDIDFVLTVFFLISAIVCIILTFILPLKIVLVFSITTFILLALFSFFGAKTFLKYSEKIFGKKKNKKIPFLYALKNAKRVETLGNTTGMVAVCVIVLLSIFTILLSGYVDIDVNKYFLQGDFLVINASENADDILRNTEGVEDVYHLYKDYAELEDKKMMLISTDNRKAITSGLDIDVLPTGNQVYFTKVFAEFYGIELNDEVTIKVGNKELKCVYAKGLETTDQMLFIDADYWGIPKNYTIIDGNDNINQDVLYKNIMLSLSMESATVIRTEEFTNEWVKSILSSILCATILVIFVVFFACIGMGDSIAESYRSRREEFACYKAAGMGKASIRAMKSYEIFISFLIGIVIAFIIFIPAFFVLNRACNALVFDFVWIWQEAAVFL